MRATIGLLSLTVAGSIAPVGLSAMSYFAPLLAGTIAALLTLVTVCLLSSAVRRRHSRDLVSPRPAPRRGMVVRSAEHRAT
jgi:membrane protein implicated in regulation of membrane protease activity